MNLQPLVTPLILTLNEAPNIGRALERLSWAKDILVVDSFSTDETPALVRDFQQVRDPKSGATHFLPPRPNTATMVAS